MNKELLQQTLDALRVAIAQPEQSAQPMQGLAAYLRCQASVVFFEGHPSYDALIQWGKEVDAAIAQPEQGKLLQIIAATYQIAGVYDAPAHVLDVLANPEGATQEQIDALLPFAQPVQQAVNDAGIYALNRALEGFAQPEEMKVTDAEAVAFWESLADSDGHGLKNALAVFLSNRLAATSAKPAQTYTGDDLAMAYKDGYAAGGVSMAQGDAKDAERLDFLISNRAYVVSDKTCTDGYWLHYIVTNAGTLVQASEHTTPREAIDAAIASQKGEQ